MKPDTHLSGSIGHTNASLLAISMPSSRMVRKLIFAVETLPTSWLWACKLPLLAMDPHMALSIGGAVERATSPGNNQIIIITDLILIII